MEKAKIIFVNIVILSMVVGGLYWLSTSANNRNEERIESVNAECGYSKGIITDIKSYKGHSLTVRYRMYNKEFYSKESWDKNEKRLREGDSIFIRYSIKDPTLIITELEDEY